MKKNKTLFNTLITNPSIINTVMNGKLSNTNQTAFFTTVVLPHWTIHVLVKINESITERTNPTIPYTCTSKIWQAHEKSNTTKM